MKKLRNFLSNHVFQNNFHFLISHRDKDHKAYIFTRIYEIITYIFLLCIGVGGIIFFFPGIYISEIIRSFLPLFLVYKLVYLLVTISFTYFLFFVFYQENLPKIVYAYLLFYVVTFGLLVGDVVKYGYSSDDVFVTSLSNAAEIDGQDNTVRIFFINIYEINTDYEQLLSVINNLEADIVLLIEYMDHHHTAMSGYLLTTFPHTNLEFIDLSVGGNVIFSRTQFSQISPTKNVYTRKYAFAHRDFFEDSENGLYLYGLHTAAPTDPKFFYQRNRQLREISRVFQDNFDREERNDEIVMIGDFNVSPWSTYMREFLDNGNGKYSLMRPSSPFFSTWCFAYKTICYPGSHIDHLFLTDRNILQKVTSIPVSSSDHDGLLIEVLLD